MDALTERRAHYLHYVLAVTDLCHDPEARRRLESGRGRPVDEVGQLMHRHIADLARGQGGKRAHYTIASLIARHRPRKPDTAATGDAADPQTWTARPNLGATYAFAVADGRLNRKPTESRLESLARLGSELLHRRLGTEIDYLHSVGFAPDWALLLDDLARWPWHQPQIASRWLEQFYFGLADRT